MNWDNVIGDNRRMKFWVGLTDGDWHGVVSRLAGVDEVNFWQPGENARAFRAIAVGEPFLFKLHSPANYIVGGGFFAHWTLLPISLAWEAFGTKNGAMSYLDMRRMIMRLRGPERVRNEDFQIGCVLLEQPFFFDRADWIPAPSDWRAAIQRGKRYSIDDPVGRQIWDSIQLRLAKKGKPWLSDRRTEEGPRYGTPLMVRPRLGQGSFRVLVTDAYQRSCAISGEHSLPALEAAHIMPFNESGPHAVSNGILLRSDFHRLFDRGYLTVMPEYRIEVSKKLKEEFENGRSYYPYQGHTLSHFPKAPNDWPQKELLAWHNENVFKA